MIYIIINTAIPYLLRGGEDVHFAVLPCSLHSFKYATLALPELGPNILDTGYYLSNVTSSVVIASSLISVCLFSILVCKLT